MSKNRFAPWHTVTANKTSADSFPKAAVGSGGTNEHKLEVKSCSQEDFCLFCSPHAYSSVSVKHYLKEGANVQLICIFSEKSRCKANKGRKCIFKCTYLCQFALKTSLYIPSQHTRSDHKWWKWVTTDEKERGIKRTEGGEGNVRIQGKLEDREWGNSMG